MNPTPETIQADIAGYETRIQEAEAELASLPEGRLPYQEHKRREKRRQELQADIRHLKQLLTYAEGAL